MTVDDQEIADFCALILNLNGNPWHKTRFIKIYVRNPGHHCIEYEMEEFLDVANLEIPKKYRGQGIFMRMLDILEQHRNLYVDQVFTSKLARALLKRGYTLDGKRSYYKRKG